MRTRSERTLMKMRDVVHIVSSTALIAGIVAPVIAPMEVSADSNNTVTKILNVEDGYKSDIEAATAPSSLMIKEKNVEFTSGDTFRLILPSGVKWITDKYDANDVISGTNGAELTVLNATNQYVELMVSGTWNNGKETVNIPLYFEVDGAEGELKVEVESRGSTINSGQYTFAIVSDNKIKATVDGISKGYDSIKLKQIRIDELALGALKAGDQIVLTLPPNSKFSSNGTVSFLGAFEGAEDATIVPNGRKAIINIPAPSNFNKLGSIIIEGLSVEFDDNLPFENIDLDISGDVTAETLTVGQRIDFNSRISGTDPTTLIAGRNNTDIKDLETAEITLSESLVNTWASGRNFKIEFPEWTKIVGYKIKEVSGFELEDIIHDFNDEVKGDDNEIEITMPSVSGKRKLVAKFYLSTKADAEGDVTASFSGAGVEVKPVVVAKVVKPITVEINKANVKTGMNNQPLHDIVISETMKGMLIEDGTIELKLGDQVEFSKVPEVEVIEGDLDIDQSTVAVEDGVLSFTVDSESRTPSKIKISGIEVNLDRTVPEGDIAVEIGGTAVVQNQDFSTGIAFTGDKNIGNKTYDSFDISSSSLDVGEFDQAYVVKQAVAGVVTPADGNNVVNEVIFKVGSTAYVKGDKESMMDVAPFVEAERTYIPIRYVAEALDINEDNILWNHSAQQVTLLKNNRVAQLRVGSKVLKINNANISMDVQVKNVNGRTVLPLRSVAQVFGASVDWNEADQTIIIK